MVQVRMSGSSGDVATARSKFRRNSTDHPRDCLSVMWTMTKGRTWKSSRLDQEAGMMVQCQSADCSSREGQVGLPAPTRCLTTFCNPSPRGFDTLLLPPWALHTTIWYMDIYASKTPTHIKVK